MEQAKGQGGRHLETENIKAPWGGSMPAILDLICAVIVWNIVYFLLLRFLPVALGGQEHLMS